MITWWEWVLITLGAFYLLLSIIYFTNSDLFICARRRFPLPDPYEHAVREAIKTGLLMFNIPAEMTQGKKELVEVKIARSTELHEALVTGLLGRGEPVIEQIEMSLYMEVKLSGPTFDINSDNPPEQMVIPTPAHWEFDVTPCRAGNRTITLIVNLRVEVEGRIVAGRRSVSAVRKPIHVQVNLRFAARNYISNNWQWLIPTILTLAGAVAAWLVVPF